MNQNGQAYSTFKLLIAAIVAMAILAILIPIIMQVMGLIKADPLDETKKLLSDLESNSGTLKHTQEVVFEPDGVLAGSSLEDGVPLSKDQICMSTGAFKEDTDSGFECIGCGDSSANQHRIRFNGNSERTAKIAVVCNDKLALMNDIDVYGLDEGEASVNITASCEALCAANAKCCAVVLKRS